MSDYNNYRHCIQKRPEKKDFIEQDVSPSRASSAKQRTGWGGKELHTGTETMRHRCPGARYGKQVGGGGGGRRSEGIGLTHAHGEGEGVTYQYRGISASLPGTVKLVRGEVEEMKRSD